MPLQSLEPTRLYRQIAGQLRELMLAGEYAPGARLPAERDLARELGVSRPSVREALIALEVEGWVEVRTGSGVYVLERGKRGKSRGRQVPASEWGPLELIRARRAIEGEIASLAAGCAKRRDIASMSEALADMAGESARGLVPLNGDRAFHSALVRCCGNAVLTETVERFWDARDGALFARLVGYFETERSWRAAIAEHEAILAAVRAHDAKAARAAMQRHMDKSHARLSASWRRARAAS